MYAALACVCARRAIEAGGGDDDEDDAAAGGRRGIEALAPLDHTAQVYAEFAKDFYEEAPDIAKMTDPEVGWGWGLQRLVQRSVAK